MMHPRQTAFAILCHRIEAEHAQARALDETGRLRMSDAAAERGAIDSLVSEFSKTRHVTVLVDALLDAVLEVAPELVDAPDRLVAARHLAALEAVEEP